MKKKYKFKLIDGEFTPSDAGYVLLAFVNSKISFHSRESFGITIRTSGDISFHENRIKQLKLTNSDIKKVVDYASENKLHLKINGTIDIQLIDEQA